jgi:fumarate reductase flavoprotein subunit
MEQDACRGVTAELSGKETSYSARAVFIADGGFQGNEDLVKQYISQRPERLKQRGAGTGRGDGMQMASRVGAELIGMDRFYGHMQSRDAMSNPNLWPYPYLDSLVTAGIVVDPQGHRFVDEGRGGVYVANCVAKLHDPMSAYVIFDHQTWEKAGKNGLIPANPHLEKEGATIFRAESLDLLAKVSGLPISGLLQVVNEYNSALSSQRLSQDLLPIRSSSKYEPCPIVKAPFFAVPMVPGITYTMGGIRVNAHAQALRENGLPIEGLYALGAATGGLEGGPEVGYVGGLAKGGVTALLAAEHFSSQQSVV